MVDQKLSLFRKESLERLSSPERLDQLMQVISPKDWLPLATLGSLVVVTLVWSIFGRIPITVEGKGVLLPPRKVVLFQSPSSGQLLSLKVNVGDVVKKGQVLATIDQPDLRKQVEQQRAKRKELQAQAQGATSLQGQRTNLEIKSIQQQRQSIQQRIRENQALTPLLKDKGIIANQKERQNLLERIQNEQALVPVLVNKDLATIQQDRQNLQKRLQETSALTPVLKKRWQRMQKLFDEDKAISEDLVLQAQQQYLESIARIADLESQLKQLDLKQTQSQKSYRDAQSDISSLRTQLRALEFKEVEAEKSYRENLSTISSFETQLKELDSKEKNLAQQNLESDNTRKNQIQDVNQTIDQLELQLQNNSQVKSDYSGRILEITATVGQVVSPGIRLGSINAEESASKIVGVTYFPVQDGKKIKPDMKVQVTPSTVKRERFGGILGTVKQVSPFPITKEGAASVVGIPELVESMASQGPQMEVLAELKPDSSTVSGYQWSSSREGPKLQITAGTTTSVRVTVEEQPPITFVLPFLKSFFGVD